MQVEMLITQRFKFINYCPVIVDDENKSCILIDPSWEKRKFQDFIQEKNLEVVAILLTHHHLDHTHLANYFSNKFDCPVYMNSAEIEYYGFDCHRLKPIYPDQTILNIKQFPTVIVHNTPGHTFGGLCYQIDNALFTGDTLFNEGCGFCHTKGGHPGMMFDSLSYLKRVIADNVIIYPGHRFHNELGQKFADVKKMNIYLNINDKDEFIRFRSQKGKNFLNFR